MHTKSSMLAAALIALAGLAPGASASVGDFRVLPYQQNPTTQGMQLTWFTTSETPGTISITGPNLANPIVLSSTPTLTPVLDYQSTAELTAGGAFPFATTGIFSAPGVPARNYKHVVALTGLAADTEYSYTVTQGASTYSNTFRTAPTAASTRPMRFAVLSDSETLVSGRTRNREWSRTTPQLPGSTGRPAGTGRGRSDYLVTETLGYQENIKQIELRDPDMVIMPGDLIEGTANEQQRRWDEFWRHNAGQYDDLLSGRPIVAAIGNNCIFNGGSDQPSINANVQYARNQWSAYWDSPANGQPQFQDLYYRTDYGPITIITLCSVGSMDANDNVGPPANQSTSPGFPQLLDTNRAWLNGYPFGDVPDFNVGTAQWNWAVQQLADARAQGQVIFVQWHHTPFSRGIHGTSVTSPQSGEAMRIYAPLMEQYKVAAVFCGHSEVSEMSYFDIDGDGYGVHLWDVGAAGDGLRGVEDAPGATNGNITNWRNNPLSGGAFVPNPYHVWSADQSEPEQWSGTQLLRGGKHYGFLEVNVQRNAGGEFQLDFQYFHNFPLNAGDANYTVTGFELRPYSNRVQLRGPADNLRPVALCDSIDFNNDNVFPDDADLSAYFNVLAGGPCPFPLSCDIDFNNDGIYPDDADILSFFSVLAGGPCR